MSATLINNRPSNASSRYNRVSVERAFIVHDVNFQRKGPGYTVLTAIGVVHLRSLREAAIFVTAMAEKGRKVAGSS